MTASVPYLFVPVFSWPSLPGGKLHTYAAGGTTPVSTYAEDGVTLNTNPVTLDSTGSAVVRLSENQAYHLVLKDSTDTTTMWDADTYQASYVSIIDSTGITYDQTPAEAAQSVTPTNSAYLPGAWQRYGASPSNNDNGIAINNALLCNPVAFDANTSAPAIYPVKTTIRARAAGQKLKGQGAGDINTVSVSAAAAPRTTLQWTGTSGGKLFSVSNGSQNWSELTIEDIFFDGNHLALYPVEGYDDNLTTGCFRNTFRKIGAANGLTGTSTAIYLGNNASGFANDCVLDECYLWACANGIYATGAVHKLFACTIGLMTVAGINQAGNGSEIKDYGSVFHGNAVDVLTTNLSPIQNFMACGTWFENSTAGIFDASNSFNAQFIGCHLHTFNASFMMNLRGQAGNLTIKSWAAAGASSYLIANTNATSDYDFIGTGLVTDTGYKQKVVGLGTFDNAKFMVAISGNSGTTTGNGTPLVLNNNAVNKLYDLASAVSASTGIFTAPASGYYQFTISLELIGVTSAHNDAQLNLIVTGTSAQTYVIERRNPGTQLVAATTESHITGTCVVPMTAGDTASAGLTVSGSTAVVGVLAAAGGQNWRTFFQGRLT